MTHTYPLTASISRQFWLYNDSRLGPPVLTASGGGGGPTEVSDSGSVSRLYALRNTLNYYKKLSPHYAVSSSNLGGGRDLLASSSANGGIDTLLVSIPSIFYGSSIKKGTVSLKTYVSGTMVAELQDKYRNGDLIQVSGTTYAQSQGSGSIAGVVLYNEGFVVLTGSWNLDPVYAESYDGVSSVPKWKHFAYGILGSAGSMSDPTRTSHYLGFKGTTVTPTITMFAHARKNELNHSNNPTFVSGGGTFSADLKGYRENDGLKIKNTTYSDYNDPTGSFKKTTYS